MTDEQFRAWIVDYGDAFERQDADAAAALFTSKSTYQWGPFGEHLRGPDEIRRKWSESTDPTQDVRFGFEVLAVTEELGTAIWRAAYTYPDKVLRYEGIFAVSLTDEGLCDEFREWWNTTDEPRD